MNIADFNFLPHVISDTEDLASSFSELFSSESARNTKKLVYFFKSVKPIPRLKGESDILYIGKTEQSLFHRYHRYSKALASNQSGIFYKYIIDNYGGLRLGYVLSETPKIAESKYFEQYRATYLENPPKSSVG